MQACTQQEHTQTKNIYSHLLGNTYLLYPLTNVYSFSDDIPVMANPL